MMMQVNTPKIIGAVRWTLVYYTVVRFPSGGTFKQYWRR